LLILFAKVWIS